MLHRGTIHIWIRRRGGILKRGHKNKLFNCIHLVFPLMSMPWSGTHETTAHARSLHAIRSHQLRIQIKPSLFPQRLEHRIQGLFKDIRGPIPSYSRTQRSLRNRSSDHFCYSTDENQQALQKHQPLHGERLERVNPSQLCCGLFTNMKKIDHVDSWTKYRNSFTFNDPYLCMSILKNVQGLDWLSNSQSCMDFKEPWT